MSEPETLIQSQQVTLTGPVHRVQWLLTVLKLDHQWHDITVTLTPTSVPDARGSVEQDGQIILRISNYNAELRAGGEAAQKQLEGCAIAARSYAKALTFGEQHGFGDELKKVLICRQSLDSALAELERLRTSAESRGLLTECCLRFIRADERYCPRCGWEARVIASPDAQGSVTEQSQQNPRQWISVEDRLPEPDQYVLTCGGRILKLAHPARVLLNQDGKTEFWWGAAMVRPTHWMPMIEPPDAQGSVTENPRQEKGEGK